MTWVAAILLVVSGIAGLMRGAREQPAERLEISKLSESLGDLADALNDQLLDDAERKKAAGVLKKERKKTARNAKKSGQATRRRLFVLDFDGDIQASAVSSLRQEINAILQVARDDDEVLVRLESAGGLVHSYGLAASQLVRLRNRQLKLTVAVDKVAASGGYMMACVADRILAAPFAIVGSIGVVAQLPNFSRLLRKHDIDFELHTAGEHKRTLTMLGENTEAGRAKFREEIEETHTLFKNFVAQNRPVLDIAQVATGEHWFGTQALELKLVDQIMTSDDYLLAQVRDVEAYELHFKRRKPLGERLAQNLLRLASLPRRLMRTKELGLG